VDQTTEQTKTIAPLLSKMIADLKKGSLSGFVPRLRQLQSQAPSAFATRAMEMVEQYAVKGDQAAGQALYEYMCENYEMTDQQKLFLQQTYQHCISIQAPQR